MTLGVIDSHSTRWVGIVVDVNDPLKAGRLKIRIFGRHDDVSLIPDDALPWSNVLMPVTSASRGEIGASPVGCVVGSRVYGEWIDNDFQYPLVLGTLTKSGNIDNTKTTGDSPYIDINYGSSPAGSRGIANNTYTQAGGGSSKIKQIDSNLYDIDSVSKTDGWVATREISRTMYYSSHPTIGAASKSDTRSVFDLVRSYDPLGSIMALPCMPTQLLSLKNLLMLTSSLVSMMKSIIVAAVKQVILRIAQKLGLFKVLSMLNIAAYTLSAYQQLFNAFNVKICGLNVINQKVFDVGNMAFAEAIHGLNTVTNFVGSAGNLALQSAGAAINGVFDNLITKPLASTIGMNTERPASGQIIPNPPDNYIRKYYSDSDPYPGYIEWVPASGDGISYYTARNGEPNYRSATEHANFAIQDFLMPRMLSALSIGRFTGETLQSLALQTLTYSQQTTLAYALGGGYKILAGLALAGLVLNTPLAKDMTATFSDKISRASAVTGNATASVNKFIANQAKMDALRTKANIGLSQKSETS